MTGKKQQRGAALLIVLLLAATLSFIALASTERITLASARSMNVQARSEMLWRAFATEALAQRAIETAYRSNEGKISLDDPWASSPLTIPLDDGAAQILFADGALCFNINSLAAVGQNSGATPAQMEFIRLAVHLGLNDYDAASLADALADWVDDDNSRRPQGAEDEYYTGLPSPYRTGNQPISGVSEIRAVRGLTASHYALLKPYVCAGGGDPAVININMLSERHAPVLAAMLGDEMTLQAARDVIAARPLGGYPSSAAFLEALKPLEPAEDVKTRLQLETKRFQARAEIVYDSRVLEVTTDFVVSDKGEALVRARRIGAEE